MTPPVEATVVVPVVVVVQVAGREPQIRGVSTANHPREGRHHNLRPLLFFEMEDSTTRFMVLTRR